MASQFCTILKGLNTERVWSVERERERGGKSNKAPRCEEETRVLENEVRFTEEQKICRCTPEVCRSLPLSPPPSVSVAPFAALPIFQRSRKILKKKKKKKSSHGGRQVG